MPWVYNQANSPAPDKNAALQVSSFIQTQGNEWCTLTSARRYPIQMHTDGSLTVRVERRGDKYTWQLHRDGRFHPVKFSAPVYVSEEAARAAGNEVRTDHLAQLARLAARRPRAK